MRFMICWLAVWLAGCSAIPADVRTPAAATADDPQREAAYNDFVLSALTQMGAGLQGVSALAERVSTDAGVIEDDGWNAALTAEVERIRAAAQGVRELDDVPWRYAALHADLVEVVTLYEEGAMLMRSGFTERDPDKLEEAASLLRAGVERAEALLDDLEALGA